MANAPAVAEFLDLPTEVVLAWDPSRVPDDVTNPSQIQKLARWLAIRHELSRTNQDVKIPDRLFSIGFIVGLVLCLLTFIAVVAHIGIFQFSATSLTEGKSEFAWGARLIATRMALLSSGVLAGAALAFLGMCLFLLGIRNAMAVDAQSGSWVAKLTNVAPGTLLALCAAALIGYCSTQEFSISYPLGNLETTDPRDPVLRIDRRLVALFQFYAPNKLLAKLQQGANDARLASNVETQRCHLKELVFLAESFPILIKDHREQLRLFKQEGTKCDLALEALQLRLNQIAGTKSLIESNSSEALTAIDGTIKRLSEDLENIAKQ